MSVELISNSNFDALGPAPHERDDWVEMQLCMNFIRDTRQSMMGSLVGSWVVAGVLYKAAPMMQLVLWLVLINLVILARYMVCLQYSDRMRDISGPALQAFFKQYDVWWVLAGVLWGASTYLFIGVATGFEQLICGLILIGASCFSVYSYAARLSCFFSFSSAFSGTALVGFSYQLLFVQKLSVLGDSLGLMVLTVVFYLMTRHFAIGFHGLQRTSLQLQFDNDVLIKSLTAKSADAMRAVDNKNRFIASAAHDLRQPVHALNLYASWLVDEPELGPQVAPHIVRCTHAVNDLFNSLFDFSGLDTDVTKVNWQQINLADLMVDLQLQYAPLARELGLRLRLRQSSCWVRTDPVLLKRLLGNLISNALKNTAQGGVLLALRQPAGRWRVEVWDTGVGIEPEYQKAIFKEFYRVPRPGTEEGFGLGLAIARRLSQLLGHSLHVRSRRGRGSVFWIEQGNKGVPLDASDRMFRSQQGDYKRP